MKGPTLLYILAAGPRHPVISFSAGIVLRWLSWGPLGRDVAPRHATVDNEVGTVDKAALVARQEEYSLGLLDGLTEATTGEVHLTTEALGLVIAQPVLQKGCAIESMKVSSAFPHQGMKHERWGINILERTRAKRVETESLTGMDNSQLTSHSQHSSLDNG